MSRFRPILLAFVLLLMPAATMAQTPTTPIDQLTLRIEAGNGYTVLTDPNGAPVQADLHQVIAGVYPEEMNPVVVDFYTRTGAQDVFIAFTSLVPPGDNPEIAISIEMRVFTFGAADGAALYVNEFAQEWPRQAEALGLDPQVTPLDDLPAHGGAIFGFSSTEPLFDVTTGASLGEAPYTRILAQRGATVASAKVIGADSTLNRLMAIELLHAQLACIEQDSPCTPVPPPVEFPHSPTATPAAFGNVIPSGQGLRIVAW